MKRAGLLILGLSCVIFAGCVKMRDYTSARNGWFGLDIQKGFGEGEEKKDYYLLGSGIAIIAGDTKNEITNKIGSPDSIEKMLDGLESWLYKDKNLRVYFDGNYLKTWEEI